MGKHAVNVIKFLVFLLFAGVAAYFLFFTPTGALFRTQAGRGILVERLDHLVRAAGLLGPVVFVLVYALSSIG